MVELSGHSVGGRWGRLNRARALWVVAGAYLAAGAAGLITVLALRAAPPIAVTLAADLVATAVVFGVSLLVANASLYDPYWSVAPPVVVIAWAWAGHAPAARRVLVTLLVTIWGVRLTLNWASGWRGLGHEDWRYVQLRDSTRGRLPWWLVSLGGIQLMPTLLVFAGLLSLWPATTGGRPFGALDLLAGLVIAAAIATEAVADWQLRHFTADPAHRGEVAETGLWRYSRHPNYLGEICFWWGLWLFGLASAPAWWWTVIGPAAMVILFVFASVPMMDKRLLDRRPQYAAYLREVPALLPRPRPGRADSRP